MIVLNDLFVHYSESEREKKYSRYTKLYLAANPYYLSFSEDSKLFFVQKLFTARKDPGTSLVLQHYPEHLGSVFA